MEHQNQYIMVIETSDYLNRLEANQFNLFTQKLHNSLSKTLSHFSGSIIEHNDNKYVVAFEDLNDAVLCCLKIQSKFKYITPNFDGSIRRLQIGLCHPLNNLEETIQQATNICEFVKHKIATTYEVKSVYEQNNTNSFLDRKIIKVLKPSEFAFLVNLIGYLKDHWNNYELSVEELSEPLGYSHSQIYRKTLALTGKSPSAFIRDYRLNRALKMIHLRKGNIGKIAKRSGFRSPTYFSKCFKEKFGLLASTYAKQHTV